MKPCILLIHSFLLIGFISNSQNNKWSPSSTLGGTGLIRKQYIFLVYSFLLVISTLKFTIVNSQNNTWTPNAAGETDWHKPCNWSLGIVPTSAHDVYIPNSSSYPVITGNAHCNELFITSTTSNALTINSSGSGNLCISSTNGGVCSTIPLSSGGCEACTPDGTFTDARDGNVYGYVNIGSQVWMCENLAYLPSVNPPTSSHMSATRYYVYGYSGTNVTTAKATANYDTYGVLYNWTAAMQFQSSSNSNPSFRRGVCPAGWHMPSHSEWCELENFLESTSCIPPTSSPQFVGTNLGGMLKEMGTNTWNSPNTGATNSSKFSALGGGQKTGTNSSNNFSSINTYTSFWSATQENSTDSWHRAVYSTRSDVFRNSQDKDYGYYVRCIRD